MDTAPPFVPPAPTPRTTPPSTLEMIRIVYRNPLELWGEPSYNEPYISVNGIGGPLVIANDPALIRHVLVDNAKNYKMATVRQKILRPILRDGLLTAEGDVWKRSRKAMAPVFTPRHIFGFAKPMLERSEAFAERYADGETVDVAVDMTLLTYDILAETLFSGEIAGEPGSFAAQIDRLFETMGRVDPLDLLRAPDWLPRLTRLRGRKTMALFPQDRGRHGGHAQGADGGLARRCAGRFPDAAAAGRGPERADARRDRGQHHHLHRRRARNDGAGARLDHLLPGGSAVGARADRARDRRGAGARARPGEMARRHAADQGGFRGGAAGSIRRRLRSTASRSSRSSGAI